MVIKFSKKNIAVFLIALSPFLVNYELPVVHKNFTLIIYMLIVLAVMMNLLRKHRFRLSEILSRQFSCGYLLIFMLNYLIFESFYVNHPLGLGYSLVQIGLLYIQILGLICFFRDKEVRNLYKKLVCRITLVMCALIFIQYVLYYCGGFLPGGNTRTAWIPFKFLFIESVVMTSKQGMIINGFFRPSAMFLEPSHFSAYCSIGLLCMVFGQKRIDWKSAFVSLAICMTTSGIGIASVAAIWAIYIFLNLKSMNKKKMVKAAMLILFFIWTFVVLYYNFSFFRTALSRFHGPDNALSGRLSGRLFIEELHGKDRWFGVGYKNFLRFDSSNISYYFSSIMELLYCQGIVGFILFCVFYLYALIKMYHSHNQENFAVMVLGIFYIIGTGIFSANQLVKYIPFLFFYTYGPNDLPADTDCFRTAAHNLANKYALEDF